MSDHIYTEESIRTLRLRAAVLYTELGLAETMVGDDQAVEESLDDAWRCAESIASDLWELTVEVCPACNGESDPGLISEGRGAESCTYCSDSAGMIGRTEAAQIRSKLMVKSST